MNTIIPKFEEGKEITPQSLYKENATEDFKNMKMKKKAPKLIKKTNMGKNTLPHIVEECPRKRTTIP